MEDSPDVEIRCVTTSRKKAREEYKKAKSEEAEWTEKEKKNNSGNWAETCMKSFDISETRKPGDDIFVVTETIWCECIDTTVTPFLYEVNAINQVDLLRKNHLDKNPDLVPFFEDESIQETMHLTDEMQTDIYFNIDTVKLI